MYDEKTNFIELPLKDGKITIVNFREIKGYLACSYLTEETDVESCCRSTLEQINELSKRHSMEEPNEM